MNIEIKVELKKIIGDYLTLSKPGKECNAIENDSSRLGCFERFCEVCKKNENHTDKDMTAVAALLFEMQIKNNVPDDYVGMSDLFSEMIKQNKKLNPSESRDYVFFAYEVMRELEKLDNRVFCSLEPEVNGVYALASQDDDISCIVIVNDRDDEMFADVNISGLPGRSTSIDYYYADKYEQLSVACNTDTKLENTKIMIPMVGHSIHMFKIR